MNSFSRRGLFSSAFALASMGLVGACVGNDPGSDDSGQSSSSSGGASSGESSSGTGGSSGVSSSSSSGSESSSGVSSSSSSGSQSSSGAASSSSGSTSSSSGGEPDAGPEPIACTDEVYPSGTYFSTCRASRSAAVPGGTLTDGNYLLSGWWACSGGYNTVYGAASIYHDGSGRQLMRYGRIFHNTSGGQAETKGTYLVEPNGSAVVRTEECRESFVGTQESGNFSYDAATLKLVYRFPDHDEEWTRQL